MEDLLNLPERLLNSCIDLNGGTDSYFGKSVLSLKAFLEHCQAMYMNIQYKACKDQKVKENIYKRRQRREK